MRCEQCREALSARLDGEDEPGERAAVDTHLAGCEACARWVDDAAAVTRLVRMAPVGHPSDLSDRVMNADALATAAPGPGRRRLAGGLRIMLGLFGFAQFLLGMAQVSLLSSGDHDHLGAGVSPSHLWHESAAWNIAVGAGFGWIAVRRTRPAGLLPLLTAFVVMLVLVSANDLWAGGVDTARLLSHAIIVAGYLIMVALSRPSLDFGDPPARGRGRGSGWRARFEDLPDATPAPRLTLVPKPSAPAVRYDRAA